MANSEILLKFSKMRDKEFYNKEAIWQLKCFGIFAFNIHEAAEFVAKILCLEGCLDKSLPDEDDQYNLNNPILISLLKDEIKEYKEAITLGIEKGTLKALHISKDIFDQIDLEETYIDLDDLYSWFSDRGIDFSGDFYAQYLDDKLEITSSAIEAIVIKEYKVENRIQERFDTPEQEKIFHLEMKILELETESQKNSSPTQKNELHPKERETLLKILLGLTLTNYEFDPHAVRNSTSREICSDLILHGLSVDEDTIRKWIKEAKTYLPDDWGSNLKQNSVKP